MKDYIKFSKKTKQKKVKGLYFYVEFCFTRLYDDIDTGNPYLIQSRCFDNIEEAENFVKNNFDFIDKNVISIDIMYYPSGLEDFDILPVEHYAETGWIGLMDINAQIKKDTKILEQKEDK